LWHGKDRGNGQIIYGFFLYKSFLI
jgi:hypothetical protein